MRLVDADKIKEEFREQWNYDADYHIFKQVEEIIDTATTIESDCEKCYFKEFTENMGDKIVDVMIKNGIYDFNELARRLRGDKT